MEHTKEFNSYPLEKCWVPDLKRKELDEICHWF